MLVSKNESCPIVNMTTAVPLLEEHYRQAQGMPGLYLSSNATSPLSGPSFPAILLKVSEYAFCKFVTDAGITPGRQDYPLAQSPRSSCAAANGSYQVLASRSEIDFFKANPQLEQLSKKEGYFPAGNFTYHLAFKGAAGWSASCRHSKLPLPQAMAHLRLQADPVSRVFVFVVLGLGAVVFLVNFLAAVNLLFEDEKYSEAAVALLGACLWLLLLVLSVFTLADDLLLLEWGKSALALNCSDAYLQQQVLLPLTLHYSELRLYSALLTGLTCLSFFLHVLFGGLLIRRNSIRIEPAEKEEPAEVKQAEFNPGNN